MIEIRKLKQLIQLMEENNLNELDLRDKDEQVTLKRNAPGAPPQVYHAPASPPAHAPAPPAAAPGSASAPPAQPSGEENLLKITSPMVGTFYSSPSPDAEAFIKVGSEIDSETVVCLIEAMKVFNEIKAELAGTVEKVLVRNGEAVEFGQTLFLVKPK